MLTYTEENYLKAIFQLQEDEKGKISTNSIAERLSTTPATVSDMLQKLAAKKMVNYLKYYGVSLTAGGKKKAINVVRKHRLWELFLYEKLEFNWDEVHEIAEQLEHIQSETLVQKLYDFLGKPKTDPHGDPIPDEEGVFPDLNTIPLAVVAVRKDAIVIGVSDHRPDFLQYLQKIGLSIGKRLNILEIISFDKSMDITIEGKKNPIHISHDAAKSIMVNLV
ncbi:MAG: metal-dependent transcriptional regulator [Bacteroidia bacterium]|nr:metal-dependent transcriptional regulator [Bacteroidota bacterium]MBK8586737.1 metal-dependent transcriptional regulator [Bacteroidota bacterium]MBP9922527.1 metal-dependent transcriptional regulator [Bacteroidia bacterium]HQW00807.1 metal-dependent transcriptional regulator [Bacteroidia bacterium]